MRRKTSQEQRILNYLFSGRGLTAKQAYKKGWGMRLSGRIYDLRAKGNVIEKYMVSKGGSRFAEYYMNVGM